MGFERNRLPESVSYYEGHGVAFEEPRGKWRSGPCFNCGARHAMRFNTESGAFVCMTACGARGGDVIAYEMAVSGCDFVTAAKSVGAWIDDPKDQHQPRRRPLPFPPRDALEILAEEAMLVAVAAGNVARGVVMSGGDKERLMQAAGRVRAIVREVVA